MSAGDLAAVVVTVVALVAFAVLLVAVMVLWRTLGEMRAMVAELRDAISELQAEALPRMDEMVGELRTTVVEAGAEVERVDGLLDAAETISARVDSASRLGYLAFRAPLIRFVAFFEGFRRGVARLFGFGTRSSHKRSSRKRSPRIARERGGSSRRAHVDERAA